MQSIAAGASGSLFKAKLDQPRELLDFATWRLLEHQASFSAAAHLARWLVTEGAKPLPAPAPKDRNHARKVAVEQANLLFMMDKIY